ncbi:MAG: hypothetical protein KAI03_05740 [Candidatus Aureabacteria bacterium]|nr:hypothetical protein [Candidatus Auribacterota bacterium]
MKRLFIIVLCLLVGSVSTITFGAEGGEKGASSKAYEHASEKSVFNRMGDWFSTIGKSDEEKKTILEERRAKRAMKRAEKEAKKAEKETRKAKKETEKDAKELQKEAKKSQKSGSKGKKGKNK